MKPIQQRWVMSVAAAGITMAFDTSITSFGVALVAMVNLTSQTPVDVADCNNNQTSTQTNNKLVGTIAPVYNWSRQMQGYILSAYFIGCLPFQIFGGNVAQRYGGKWVVALGTLGVGIFEFFKPLSASVSPILLLVNYLMQGIASSVIWPGIFSVYGCWSPPQEMSVLSMLSMAGTAAGQCLGMLISGPICASKTLGGWPALFYINGGILLIFLIIWCLTVTSSPENHPYISPDELQYITESLKSNQHDVNQAGVPMRRIFLSRVTISLNIALFGYGFLFYTTTTSFPQYYSDVLHLRIQNNSVLLSLIFLFRPFTIMLASVMFDFIVYRKWAEKNLLRKLYVMISVVSVSCIFVSLPTISSYRSKWAITSLLVLALNIWQLAAVTYNVAPLDLTPEYSGTVTGIAHAFNTLGAVMAPLVVDSITVNRAKKEWDIVFYLTSALVAATGLIFLIFGSSERQYQWTEEINEHPLNENIKTIANEMKPLILKGNEKDINVHEQ